MYTLKAGMSCITIFQSGSAQENMTNLPPPPPLTNISGTYKDPIEGFEIQLPQGWSGVSTYGLMASPRGINSTTHMPNSGGPNDNILMIKTSIDKNSYFDANVGFLKSQNATSYEDLVKKGELSCGGLSSLSYLQINGINVQNIIEPCGLMSDKEKSIIYSFATNEKIITIGFQGTLAAVDANLPKVEQSIQTLKIERPADIKIINEQMASEALK